MSKICPTPSARKLRCRVDNATTQSSHWRVGAFFEIPPLPHFPWLYIIILKTKWNRVQNLLYEYIEYLYRYIYVFSFKYSNFIDIVKNHWIKIFSSWKKRLPPQRKVFFVALTTRHHAPPRCIALRICQYWNYMSLCYYSYLETEQYLVCLWDNFVKNKMSILTLKILSDLIIPILALNQD